MQERTTDDHEAVYALTLDDAFELLDGLGVRSREDGSWVWPCPKDETQYVARTEGPDRIEFFLTEDGEGELWLSGHRQSTGRASFNGAMGSVVRRYALSLAPGWSPPTQCNDPSAVRRIVEEETRNAAEAVARNMGWTDGGPSGIDVTEGVVSVRYPGALPGVVAGPLRDGIVEVLLQEGFDYRHGAVRIVPHED